MRASTSHPRIDWGRENAMSMVMSRRAGANARRVDLADAVQYRLIYAICFAVFLVAAIIARVMPWNWQRQRGADRRQSILEQAGEAAGTCTTYAFMS
jgi:hypothetical protein